MLEHLKNATNVAYTENGATAYATTKSAVLDLFAQINAFRSRSESDIIKMFDKSLSQEELLTMKMIFWSRDIRGGQGERRTFRTILKYLANRHPDYIRKNIDLIPEFGRWDDVYALFGTQCESDATKLIVNQWLKDLGEKYPSLMAKWLKSENTSSKESVALATKTRMILGLTPRGYRKHLSELRRRINVLERLISSNQWDKIEYDKLPSKAGLKYKDAFMEHDEDRYKGFISSLKKGEKKVNVGTLYPYELVRRVMLHGEDQEILDQMWKNLPDYVGDDKSNVLVVADTSGSMCSDEHLPIATCISLAMYFAERNHGVFANHFITFSAKPKLQQILGTTLASRINNLSRAEWTQNTDIEAVFDLILNTAKKNNLPQSDMPSRIVIISDMEFDASKGYSRRSSNDVALFKEIEQRFMQNGYTMPRLVFWNVNATSEQFPMTMTDAGVQLVSGHSPTLFTSLLKGEYLSAWEMMLKVIDADRYSVVKI